ncbi:MAG TPA: VacB/RNase II family 3'-5' exoribonuclease, partial [Phycisphaerae bacterium]|nr:VacB/RNase II family 3'-5' exoribonuclease [Phycisphaerae bacterium]
RAGDQVVVELAEYPSRGQPARGVIVEVLGRRGDPGIDTLSVIRQYHFRDVFNQEVLDAARAAVDTYDAEVELTGREDLRGEVVVTIDPDDARDYDDAISIRPLGRGRFELGVHIADVSRFVEAGGPLDEEATLRGNSIYFPRHVIPMLPEVLSNGLCSLQEDRPRLTKSAFIQYDAQGHRAGSRFANTVIRSSKRLTYGEATAILDGRTAGFDREVIALLQRMDRLARVIRKRRLAAGMIVLDLAEIELVLNDEDQVVDVAPTDTSFSHTIIEMFMVEANEVVAELFTRLDVPHLRRIHPEPPADAENKLRQFLRVLGKPIPKKMDRETMIRLLDSVKGKPESFAVNLAVLRSMAQAEYSPKMIGHFALAGRHYAHFTSPIRRYPDLTVHRLLDLHVRGKLGGRHGRETVPSRSDLEEIGRRCSYTEREAEAAERELKKIKILRLLESRLGDVEEGLVTGVSNLGIFVQLRRYLIDGLIRFRDLPADWWDVDAAGGCVTGRQRGIRIAIGDALPVHIAAVDVPARELDLALPEDALKGRGRPKQDKGRREKAVKRSDADRPVRYAGRGPGRSARRR